MIKRPENENHEQSRFEKISAYVVKRATDLERAKSDLGMATAIMRAFLIQQTGTRLLLKGAATMVGHNHGDGWAYRPWGPDNGTMEERAIPAAAYSVCEVSEEEGNVYLSVPGDEDSARFEVPIWSVRAASLEEVEAAPAGTQFVES